MLDGFAPPGGIALLRFCEAQFSVTLADVDWNEVELV